METKTKTNGQLLRRLNELRYYAQFPFLADPAKVLAEAAAIKGEMDVRREIINRVVHENAPTWRALADK